MPPTSAVLFRNVRIFNGTEKLSAPMNVLVMGNTIDKISSTSIAVTQEATAATIDGIGRTLMLGLIDAHAHIMFAAIPLTLALTADVGYLHQVAGKEAERTLMRGFTTIRDVGGPSFGLKRAIDEGIVPGPRIYPSGRLFLRLPDMATFARCPGRPAAC